MILGEGSKKLRDRGEFSHIIIYYFMIRFEIYSKLTLFMGKFPFFRIFYG